MTKRVYAAVFAAIAALGAGGVAQACEGFYCDGVDLARSEASESGYRVNVAPRKQPPVLLKRGARRSDTESAYRAEPKPDRAPTRGKVASSSKPKPTLKTKPAPKRTETTLSGDGVALGGSELKREDGPRGASVGGAIAIPPGWTLDLDRGRIGAGPESDIWLTVSDGSPKRYLTPLNGAEIKAMGAGKPDRAGCLGSGLSTKRLNLWELKDGEYLCFRTSEGRLGLLRIEDTFTERGGAVSLHFRHF